MKRPLLLVALVLVACSRNPDPEYAPTTAEQTTVESAAVVEEPAVALEAPAAPVESAVPEARALELGREVFEMIAGGRAAELWERFDAPMKAALGSAEGFEELIRSMQDQLGPEMERIDELVGVPEEAPTLTYYRRRSRYVLLSSTPLDLYVVLNADESIAGVTARPAEQ